MQTTLDPQELQSIALPNRNLKADMFKYKDITLNKKKKITCLKNNQRAL